MFFGGKGVRQMPQVAGLIAGGCDSCGWGGVLKLKGVDMDRVWAVEGRTGRVGQAECVNVVD